MKKILLVEDDPAIVSSLTLFMKNEGYLLDAANGQHAALEKIALLSQDLDRILHGEQDIRLDDYQEGELAILQNELSKMTLRLLELSRLDAGTITFEKKISTCRS